MTSLERELEQRDRLYEREYARSEALIGTALIGTAIAQTSSGSTDAVPMVPDPVAPWADAPAPAPVSARPPATTVTRPVPMPPSASPGSDSSEILAPTTRSNALSGLPLLAAVVAAGLLVILGLYLAFLRPSARASSSAPAATVGKDKTAQAQGGTNTPDVSAISPVKDSYATNGPVTPETSAARLNANNYAVVLAAGKALTPETPKGPSATYEAQMAIQDRFANVAIYQRDGRYTVLILFDNKEQAADALKKLPGLPLHGDRWAKQASIVNMSDWCPAKTSEKSVNILNTDVPVWSCL